MPLTEEMRRLAGMTTSYPDRALDEGGTAGPLHISDDGERTLCGIARGAVKQRPPLRVISKEDAKKAANKPDDFCQRCAKKAGLIKELPEEVRRLLGTLPARSHWTKILGESKKVRRELEDFVWKKTPDDQKVKVGDTKRLLLGDDAKKAAKLEQDQVTLADLPDEALRAIAGSMGYGKPTTEAKAAGVPPEQVAFTNQLKFAQQVVREMGDLMAEVQGGYRVGLDALRDGLLRINRERGGNDSYNQQAVQALIKDLEKGFDMFVNDADPIRRSPATVKRWAQDKVSEAETAIKERGWNPAR